MAGHAVLPSGVAAKVRINEKKLESTQHQVDKLKELFERQQQQQQQHVEILDKLTNIVVSSSTVQHTRQDEPGTPPKTQKRRNRRNRRKNDVNNDAAGETKPVHLIGDGPGILASGTDPVEARCPDIPEESKSPPHENYEDSEFEEMIADFTALEERDKKSNIVKDGVASENQLRQEIQMIPCESAPGEGENDFERLALSACRHGFLYNNASGALAKQELQLLYEKLELCCECLNIPLGTVDLHHSFREHLSHFLFEIDEDSNADLANETSQGDTDARDSVESLLVDQRDFLIEQVRIAISAGVSFCKHSGGYDSSEGDNEESFSSEENLNEQALSDIGHRRFPQDSDFDWNPSAAAFVPRWAIEYEEEEESPQDDSDASDWSEKCERETAERKRASQQEYEAEAEYGRAFLDLDRAASIEDMAIRKLSHLQPEVTQKKYNEIKASLHRARKENDITLIHVWKNVGDWYRSKYLVSDDYDPSLIPECRHCGLLIDNDYHRNGKCSIHNLPFQ